MLLLIPALLFGYAINVRKPAPSEDWADHRRAFHLTSARYRWSPPRCRTPAISHTHTHTHTHTPPPRARADIKPFASEDAAFFAEQALTARGDVLFVLTIPPDFSRRIDRVANGRRC